MTQDDAEPAREVLEAAQGAFPSLVLVATAYASERVDDDAVFDFGLTSSSTACSACWNKVRRPDHGNVPAAGSP